MEKLHIILSFSIFGIFGIIKLQNPTAKERQNMTANHVDNHEKFTKLYELYSHDLLCFAISIVKSPLTAEDLVHDAYGKILKHIDEIEEPYSPRTKRYLVVTVRNTCFDYLLRSVPTEELAEYKAVQDNPLNTVWDDFSANEIKEKLILFLERLSDTDRNLFIDAVIRGYRHKELAEKYHLSGTNISVKIFRLRTGFENFWNGRIKRWSIKKNFLYNLWKITCRQSHLTPTRCWPRRVRRYRIISRPTNLQKAWRSCCKSPNGGRGRILSRGSSPEEGYLRLPLRLS